MATCAACFGDNISYRYQEWTEPHGEPCFQEWYECEDCGYYSDVEEIYE